MYSVDPQLSILKHITEHLSTYYISYIRKYIKCFRLNKLLHSFKTYLQYM